MIAKKGWIVIVLTLVISSTFATCATAKGPHGQAGKSNIAHLYLYEKDPDSWDIIEEGSWGKMKYELSGETFDFVFNGHNLTPFENYTLIYYPDPWPGYGLICLGSDSACENGSVHIAEKVDTGSLPIGDDTNEGAKIWLVLSSDVDCDSQQMIGWNPESYLFEYELIHFEDTDEERVDLASVDDESEESEDNEAGSEPEEAEDESQPDESEGDGEKVLSSIENKADPGKKMKFEQNNEKLREIFSNLITRMIEKGKEGTPPGVQRIFNLLSPQR